MKDAIDLSSADLILMRKQCETVLTYGCSVSSYCEWRQVKQIVHFKAPATLIKQDIWLVIGSKSS